MAAASPYFKESQVSGFGMGLALLVLVAFGAASGVMIAMGELQALYVCLSLLACTAVLYDFRVGAVLLVILLPFSASSVFPHELMGIRGLNPINLLVLGTLGSFLLHGRVGYKGAVVPRPLLWLCLVPMVIGGLLGMRHVDEIFTLFYEMMAIEFTTPLSYFRDMVVKPALIAVVAMMIAVAVAKSQKPERFILPVVASIWVVSLLEIVFVALSGVRLGELSGTGAAREFFNTIGIHANDLGRLFLMAYSLMLFTWWEAKDVRLKLLLFITLGLISIALLLTFSRGAWVGFILVNALFLMWKFNAKTLGLGLLAVVVVASFAPGFLIRRISVGFDTGNVDDVSAGRVEGIWAPLLPHIWDSPVWGNGLGSIMWSTPMVTEQMETVNHPHNAYLQAVLDLGFVGLAALLLFYWTVWKGFRSLGSHAYLSPELRGFFQGATAGLLGFFVTGWAGSTLLPEREWVFLWVAIGMMYGMLARRPAA